MLLSKGSNKETERAKKSTFNFNSIMFSRGQRRLDGNTCGPGSENAAECELRPGGMLVQKRDSSGNQNSASSASASSTIKVKVKHGSSHHEIRVSSHASFGELKKMLTERTGLHAQDQKLIFKKKERDSKSYLDVDRVKDGSKLVLLEDIESRERRMLESLRIAKKEKASKSLIEINHEVDKLANKVSALEAAASTTGLTTAETEIESLTESLMSTLITLDEIYADGELKLQKRDQVRRVQKHIEALDMLKMKRSQSNSTPLENEDKVRKEHMQGRQGNKAAEQIHPTKQLPLEHSDSVVVTTKWETFD